MPYFQIPSRFPKMRPLSPEPRLIRDHDILRGSASHVLYDTCTRNLINDEKCVFNTSPDSGSLMGPHGRGVNFSGKDFNISCPATNSDTPFTYAVIQRSSSYVDQGFMCHTDVRGGTVDRSIYLVNSLLFRFRIGATASTMQSANGVTTAKQTVHAMSADNSSMRHAIGGRNIANVSKTDTGPTIGAGILSFGYGSPFATNDTATCTSMPLFIRLHGHAWQSAELAQWTRDPWQIFEDVPEVMYFFPSAAISFQPAWARNANTMITTP